MPTTKNPITKTMAAAAGLAAALTLTACGGSGAGDTGTNANASAPIASAASADCAPVTGALDKGDLGEAAWAKGAEPNYALVITDAYPLPESVASETSQVVSSMSAGLALAQLRGGDIKVGINDLNYLAPDRRELGSAPGIEGFGYRAAYFTPQGELIDTYEVNELDGDTNPRVDDRLSSPSDSSYGTFRIAATDGITIPAKADYSKTDGKYALDVLATDDGIWMLLRGGTDLYKAELVKTSGDADPTSCV